MPELPEVEIHARNLRRWLVGRRVEQCQVVDSSLVVPETAGELQAALQGRRFDGVIRRAKYVLCCLDDLTLVVHLRMTGRFVLDSYAAGPATRPTRLTLLLDNGTRVRFEDRRRFGRVWLVPAGKETELSELRSLGPDALLDLDGHGALEKACRVSRRSVKALLMDQHVIGGIGNICAAEILFRAGVHPATPASDLDACSVSRIARAIPRFLEWAIEAQSRKELIYLGEKGAENVFSLYRRAGEPCPACGTPIRRTVVAGRGTYWCATCQPEPAAAPTDGRRSAG
jgi:formamidopyrimidine-DNA glycosylase